MFKNLTKFNLHDRFLKTEIRDEDHSMNFNYVPELHLAMQNGMIMQVDNNLKGMCLAEAIDYAAGPGTPGMYNRIGIDSRLGHGANYEPASTIAISG